jgi:hypothetical protein
MIEAGDGLVLEFTAIRGGRMGLIPTHWPVDWSGVSATQATKRRSVAAWLGESTGMSSPVVFRGGKAIKPEPSGLDKDKVC